MASAKVAGNPTQNLYSLLSDDAPEPSVVAPVPKTKKEQTKKPSGSEKEIPGAAPALTPAEKAKAREAKQPKAPKATPIERPPRRDSPVVDSRSAGPRGTGNRGARRAINAVAHGHQAPNRGRAFDRQSGSQITRKAPAKKGGAGKGNWGHQVKDSVADQEAEGKETVENTEKAEDESPEVAAQETVEESDSQLTLDDYLKQREEAAKALAAKVGTIQPRTLENVDLTGAVEPKRKTDPDTSASPAPAAKSEAANARKGTKALNVAEVLQVHLPPIGERGSRGRGRGRGRGGRGREGGDRPPRAEGERAPRAEGERSRGADGERRGRGAPRGRGERGGRGRPLDMNNTRQFPSLGQ